MDIFSEQPGQSSTPKREYNPLVDVFEDQPKAEAPPPPLADEKNLEELNAGLNDQQMAAALHEKGPALIAAGAGAGKTKTMIHMVGTLIHRGVAPTNIMLVTFTNKAAGEIKDRLEGMIGEHAQYICAGTFHSTVFRQMLQRFPESETLNTLGIDMTEATILDEDDAEDVMKDAMKTALDPDELALAKDEGWTAGKMLKRMSFERAYGYDADSFRRKINPGDIDELFCQLIAKCWVEYDKGCRSVNGVDFSDILVMADKMLEKEPQIAEELSREFHHILLDEAQDTNPIQKSIMMRIARHHRNISLFGDPNQSIYGFNGADPNVITDIIKEFPDTKIYEIGTNYRSKKLITDIANVCVGFMPGKVTKGLMIPMQPGAENGGRFSMVKFQTDTDEATMLARAIVRDIREGTDPNEIAVLYRQRSLRMKLEEELVARKIPYRIVGDRSFFQRREVRDTVALLRFVFHPWDSLAGLRVLKHAKLGVSDSLCRKTMKEEGINAFEFIRRKSEDTLSSSGKPKKYAYKLKPFLGLCEEIKDMLEMGDDISEVRECLARLWDKVLREGVERASGKGSKADDASMDARVGHVAHVFDRVQKDLESGLDIDEIIEDLTMMVEAESGMDKREKSKINLMTMHASKGLEWENVYMMGLNNVAMPTEDQEPEVVAEGRRLFYVGITRAKKNLSMSCARRIFQNGQPLNTKPTTYIKEIESGMNRERDKEIANGENPRMEVRLQEHRSISNTFSR